MVDKTLSYLDYLKLLDIYFHFSSTPLIGDSIHTIRPLSSKIVIKERQDCIEAVLEVIKWDGKIPLSDMPDIRDILKRVFIENTFLEARDFLLIATFIRACDGVIDFLKKAYDKRPFIHETLESMKQLPALYKKIVRSINSEGYIEDSASYELSRIRTDLFGFRERMKRHLEKIMEREAVKPILQDAYISLRNNRYIIPLKPNFNEALQGIVHDYSHTLKTSFVEPVECVEPNNSINILVNEEKEEEKKVLKELTDYIRGFRETLEANLEAVKKLDFYHAIALFSLEFQCVRPEIGNDGSLEIKGAVNPFIMLSRKDDVVPIDIAMDNDKQVMIISGPNAGGKTAALKTMGLLSVMAKAGLFIPAREKPIIPFFSNIFALIGDEQDISMDLSSFTAHMYGIKDLYNHTGGGELILIDEIGGSTEPQEASALAMGVIDTLIEKKCTVIVTTHLNLIKAYGYTRPFAINVATSFDNEKMRPLYKLIYGTAGYSNAINVAKNIDVPPVIIEKSYAYLGKQEFMLNDLITGLEVEKERVDEEKKALLKLKEETRRRLTLIKDKRDEYVAKVEKQCAERLQELELEIENIKKEVAKKERASITKSRRRLTDLQARFGSEDVRQPEDIHINDHVLVKSLGSKGYVVDIDKAGDTYEVVVGNARMKLKRFFLEKTTADKGPAGTGRDQINVAKSEGPELNVMGLRAEEAIRELDRFLDRAVVDGVPKVRILHGIGTGRLMQAIQRHLTGAKYVKTARTDEKNSGVTVVEFA